ncbi:putative rlpA-like protein, double-psi beta-barrel [Helianthus annuus]|nr:putative rlpA-like protein, double-psi beta-barrel [Helianthus annuus]
MSSTTLLLLLALFSNTIPVALSHSPYSQSSTPSEWRSARATYYAAADPRDAVGGACGYGDLEKAGYGKATAGMSTVLFEKGQICGACFEVKCVDDLRWCIPGTSIIVTATNFCAPNYGFPADGGGKCNPPNAHFVLPIEIFEKIAIWKASNMPIEYRRYWLMTCMSLNFISSYKLHTLNIFNYQNRAWFDIHSYNFIHPHLIHRTDFV